MVCLHSLSLPYRPGCDTYSMNGVHFKHTWFKSYVCEVDRGPVTIHKNGVHFKYTECSSYVFQVDRGIVKLEGKMLSVVHNINTARVL